MQIKTGKGPVSLMMVIAIWSLSLAVDLPGLAVTPIEGKLHGIFHDVTDFKIQLLTVLPNVVIIPFVLLSGKLSETRHKIPVIVTGIILYALSGILSIFSGSLTVLIWLSCLLGAGCGLILPFSTGLIADVFVGRYRMKQMGIVSAIGNIALVGATFVVGFLAAKSWHLPFIVYIIPLISLLLIPWLRKIPKAHLTGLSDESYLQQTTGAKTVTPGTSSSVASAAPASSTPSSPSGQAALPAFDADGFSLAGQKLKGGFYIGRTVWLMLAYGFYEFACTVPTYYLPNLMPQYGMSTEEVSMVTSMFYFAMFIIGIMVTSVMKLFKKSTFIVSTAVIIAGYVIYIFSKDLVLFFVAAGLLGLGNGQTQPIFYNKATEIVNTPAKSTLALAFLQAANYVGISVVPVIIGMFEAIFHQHGNVFPFIVGCVLTSLVFIVVIVRYRHFVFGIHPAYYENQS